MNRHIERRPHRRAGLPLLAGGLALALVACSSTSDEPGATTSPETEQEQVEAQVPTELNVALPGALANLYVGQEAGILNYYVASLVQEGLVGVDSTGDIVPALAESWEQVDASTYVYQLRADASFHDGTPVTVDDVLASIDAAGDPEISPQFSTWYDNVNSATATGENEITIELIEPNVGFSTTPSAAGGLFVAPRSYWETHGSSVGTASSLLVGTGPYQVTEFVPDSHIQLERVETWWGGQPEVESVRFQVLTDTNARLLAQQNGDIDISFNVPLQQASQWDEAENTEVRYSADLSYAGLTFKTDLPPFDDPLVREAVAHAADAQSIVDQVLGGHGEVATAILTPAQLESHYSADESRALLEDLTTYDFDLEQARTALAASNHPDGFNTEITYPNTLPELGLTAQVLAQNLAEIGITLTVTEVPISQWFDTLTDDEHGVGFMHYTSTTADPAELTSWFLGPDNLARYDNPEIADLLAAATTETDTQSRLDLLIEANTLQATDNAYFPLWWGERAVAFNPTIQIADYGTFTFQTPWVASIQE